MAKVWKPGDKISYEVLNRLQKKADAYDKLKKESKNNKNDEVAQTDDSKEEAKIESPKSGDE